MPLLRAAEALDDVGGEGDERVGVEIVKRALDAPIKQIAENGGVNGAIVAQKVREGKGAFGYDASTDEYRDLVEAGIIDPRKVVRSALQNAASVAGLLLTTDALVGELPKKQKPAAPAPPRAATARGPWPSAAAGRGRR